MVNFFLKKVILGLLIILFLFPFHIIKAVDISDSDDVVVSARVIDPGIVVTPIPASNSNGAVNLFLPQIGVSFKGEAYPNAKVTILKNGSALLEVFADGQGYFNTSVEEKYESTVLYSLFAQDTLGNKSVLVNYPLAVYSGYITELKNIKFAPTILSDKSEVIKGDYITIAGYSLPNRLLALSIDGFSKNKYTVTSNQDGSYKITIPLVDYLKGEYTTNIKYLDDTRISKFLKFIVGDTNKKSETNASSIKGDCNRDGVINLIDFSVLAFWYKKPKPPSCVDTNQDKTVDLIDFSILAYYWTN
jgi:hypothetical protein